jgi:large subunit ribosomal protein L3
MPIGFFAKKLGMTHVFNELGVIQPVTVLRVDDCRISRIKTLRYDGYNAVQIAYNKRNVRKSNYGFVTKVIESQPRKKITKPQMWSLVPEPKILDYFLVNGLKNGVRFEKTENSIEGLCFQSLSEFRVKDTEGYRLGEKITVELFKTGQMVRVTGNSIGKGFAGNQKRHNFSRGPMTHGSKNHRLPGSIGAGSTPGRVYPGKKMAGRLGNRKSTIRNSKVLFSERRSNGEQVLILKGSLPGKTNSILRVEKMDC